MLTAPRETFTTNTRKLNYHSFPMRLWQKAKKFGIWNPSDIDFSQDVKDWLALNDLERELLLNLAAMYQAGEESVTLDLLPLIMIIAQEGRLEEEMFLTSFLWEEAKHLETFGRFMNEVAHADGDLSRFHTPSYHTIFYQELHTSLERLKTDSSPIALAEASVTYNMIVEGVLAETGYHAYYNILERNQIMPGMRYAMQKFKQDESRHIAYGVYLLSRLVAEHGDPVWRILRPLGRLWLSAFGWRMEGAPPDVDKFIIVAAPHTSNWDLPFLLAAGLQYDLRVHWMGKTSIFKWPFAGLMRWLGGVPVDRSKSSNAVQQMVDHFAETERLALVIAPAGTRTQALDWKSGFYHIAHQAKVPLALGFLDYKNKTAGFKSTFYPTGDYQADLPKCRNRPQASAQ